VEDRVKKLSFISIIMVFSLPAIAQTPVYVDVAQCRNITVDLVRVACYDALADQALGRIPPTAAAAPTPSQPTESDTSSTVNRKLLEENWRMREQLARLRKDQEANQEDEGTSWFDRSSNGRDEDNNAGGEFYARIAALGRAQDGWIVTLENGQVWRQMETRRYNLRTGQEVRIYPTRWGNSYRLSVSELGSFIQVERIK
jgi:hypothetical protein